MEHFGRLQQAQRLISTSVALHLASIYFDCVPNPMASFTLRILLLYMPNICVHFLSPARKCNEHTRVIILGRHLLRTSKLVHEHPRLYNREKPSLVNLDWLRSLHKRTKLQQKERTYVLGILDLSPNNGFYVDPQRTMVDS